MVAISAGIIDANMTQVSTAKISTNQGRPLVVANVFGISGGIIAATTSLDVDSYLFLKGLKTWFKPWDAWYGIIKGLSFGLAITSISCYFGFYAKGGAAGVGKATTSSVVSSCIAIMILDYVLASLLL